MEGVNERGRGRWRGRKRERDGEGKGEAKDSNYLEREVEAYQSDKGCMSVSV